MNTKMIVICLVMTLNGDCTDDNHDSDDPSKHLTQGNNKISRWTGYDDTAMLRSVMQHSHVTRQWWGNYGYKICSKISIQTQNIFSWTSHQPRIFKIDTYMTPHPSRIFKNLLWLGMDISYSYTNFYGSHGNSVLSLPFVPCLPLLCITKLCW